MVLTAGKIGGNRLKVKSGIIEGKLLDMQTFNKHSFFVVKGSKGTK